VAAVYLGKQPQSAQTDKAVLCCAKSQGNSTPGVIKNSKGKEVVISGISDLLFEWR